MKENLIRECPLELLIPQRPVFLYCFFVCETFHRECSKKARKTALNNIVNLLAPLALFSQYKETVVAK